VYDALVLCDRQEPIRLFAYDAAAGAVTRGLPGPEEEIAAACGRFDRAMRLSAALAYRDSVLTWRLGPDPDGTWAFLSGESASPFSVSRDGTASVTWTTR
jgi:hypothetical protein